MKEPMSDDYTAAQRLLASALESTAAAGSVRYEHDFDEELGQDWSRLAQRRDNAYWHETAELLLDYFVGWLNQSPDKWKQFEEGDDKTRATIVNQYLNGVR
jgi:hypothetical protein